MAKAPDIGIGSALTIVHSGGTYMSSWVRLSLAVLFVVSFAGCGMSRVHPPEVSDVVSVETPAGVAGVWKGTAWMVSHLWSDGDVRVSIAPGGSYVAWSDQGPIPATEAGRLLVIDRKLISDKQRLLSSFTVVQPQDNPVLVVEITGKDGNPSYVPLVRDAP
jgi:hypothetical protein